MTPVDHGRPADPLAEAIEATFGSIRELKRQVSAAGAARFGSGWSWLGPAGATGGQAQLGLVLIALASPLDEPIAPRRKRCGGRRWLARSRRASRVCRGAS